MAERTDHHTGGDVAVGADTSHGADLAVFVEDADLVTVVDPSLRCGLSQLSAAHRLGPRRDGSRSGSYRAALVTETRNDGVEEANDSTARAGRLDRRLELFEVILLALAAVLTAWCAFQSTKWGGVQADSYSRAGAARTESTRASARAGQLTAIDVNTFTAWVAAISAEERDGLANGLEPDGSYEPVPERQSGFLYARFRPEFKTAVDAWLAERPLVNPAAPPTPFATPQYQVAEDARAAELEQQADGFATKARAANQTGDNYVMLTIMFTLVLVFVGLGTKMDTLRARVFLLVSAITVLSVALIIVLTFPIKV